jgi:hypothetical protein
MQLEDGNVGKAMVENTTHMQEIIIEATDDVGRGKTLLGLVRFKWSHGPN